MTKGPLIDAVMAQMQDEAFRSGFMSAVKAVKRYDTGGPTGANNQSQTQYGLYPFLLSDGRYTYATDTGLPIRFDEEGNVVMPQGTKGTMTTPEVVVTYSATTPGFENLKRNEDYVQPTISSIDEVRSTDFSLDPRTWTSGVNPVKAVRNAIDNYFYEGQHHLDQPNGFAELMRHGKYGIPITLGTGLAVGSAIDAPFTTFADFIGGTFLEDITNGISERLTGKGVGEHVADAAGFQNPAIAEVLNPFAYASPWQSKKAAKLLIDHITDGQPSALTSRSARRAKKKLLEEAHNIVSPSAPAYHIPFLSGIETLLDQYRFTRPFKRTFTSAPEKFGREFGQNVGQQYLDSGE